MYNCVPLIAFFMVYFVTCVFGALMFLGDVTYFIERFEFYSGTSLPAVLSDHELIVIWVLLMVGPILLAVGYGLALRVGVPSGFRLESPNVTGARHTLILNAVFYLLAGIGCTSLFTSDADFSLQSWVSFSEWMAMRWVLFSNLSFFEFVNLYIFVPMLAGMIMMTDSDHYRNFRFLRLLPILIVLVLSAFLFQKKSIIVSLIIIYGGYFLHCVSSGYQAAAIKRSARLFFIGVVSIYFFLVSVPVISVLYFGYSGYNTHEPEMSNIGEEDKAGYESGNTGVELSDSSRTGKKQKIHSVRVPRSETAAADAGEIDVENSEDKSGNTGKPSVERTRDTKVGVRQESRGYSYASYILMAPLTRTSAPALYYPVIYPEHHDFYGLDVGQDILGFGSMPDDNKVVWSFMNPDFPGGSASAPFHYVLYSQVGLPGSLLGCFIIGYLLAFAWVFAGYSVSNHVLSASLGILVILFAIYLAIDSVRNSVVVSYGIIWGCLLLLIYHVSITIYTGYIASNNDRS